MASFARDLRVAVRALGRAPGFALVAVLTLALGIGASTAIYSVLHGIVLKPLPYPAADRLVRLKNPVPGVDPGAEWNLSSAQFFHYGRARSLAEIGAYQRGGANVQTEDGPQRARLAAATAATVRLLGARPAVGRLLDERDDRPGAEPVAVLAHGFWRSRFGGDPGVVGRTLELGGEPVLVVGVMAAGVELPPEPGAPADLPADVWVPLTLDPAGPFYNSHVIPMIARLAPGATPEEAEAELVRLTGRLPEAYPDVYSAEFLEKYGFRPRVYPLQEYVVGGVARSLWVLLGAVGLVLVIAWANVVNLLLVRTDARRRELAVRRALGADRGALARIFLAEGLILTGAAAAVGLILSLWGVPTLVALAPATIPRLEEVRVDGSTLGFAVAVSVAVTLALSALPALRADLGGGAGALGDGGRSATAGRERQRIRAGLVIAQVALALTLVVGAGLLVESFRSLRSVSPGVDPEGVLAVRLHPSHARYPDMDAWWRMQRAVVERLRAVPGVAAAGFSTELPFTDGFGCTVQGFEDPAVYARLGDAEGTTCAGQAPTSPGYFEALGIPTLAGRTLTEADHDHPHAGAVVVSRAFAERFWPGEDPIGKGVGPSGRTEPPFYRVVGVVGDVYASSVDQSPALAVYYPMVPIPETQRWWPDGVHLVVRAASGDAASLLPAVRRAVAEVDPTLPVTDVRQVRDLVDDSMSRTSFTMVLLAIAAAAALLLAAVGLYGVISYVVARRTQEIGLRLALGAHPAAVVRMVMGGSLRVVAAGLVVGVAVALTLTHLMRGLLYGVEPSSPPAFLASLAVLTAVAVLASWVPARRAARVDPMVALRRE
ncbi:MAG TPA: ABC transporter permease [Longimicrobiaceae bacterium]|nr:ABC transporter permease [Longimicrobiaceae bacterium]